MMDHYIVDMVRDNLFYNNWLERQEHIDFLQWLYISIYHLELTIYIPFDNLKNL